MTKDHSKSFKVLSVVLIFSVIVLFLFIPVATFGTTFENTTDQTVDVVDHADGKNNFTPGKIKGQNILQKIHTSFNGKGV
ncbi:MAG: hypothetical protein KBC00_02230 [Candidatus Levybacteria bacterium]|nr:hypothetical protein [Candidatus Levybacteria bacterium]MBP9815091.1 hypothetical protein [Candidatus Levybacteria bacterium]